MKNYTFEEFKNDLLRLEIKKPQAVVAIARGGLTFAHHLAEKLKERSFQHKCHFLR